MSEAAIGQVIELLQDLPDSDQRIVLQFLKNLKARPAGTSRSSLANPALQNVDNFLVFAGEIDEPSTDWLKIVREERAHDILIPCAKRTE